MKLINLADAKNRNARIAMAHKKPPPPSRYVDNNRQAVRTLRAIKNTLDTDLSSLTKHCSLEELSQRLIDGDPELDLELFGKRVEDTVRIYLNSNNQPANGVTIKELVYSAQGELQQQRPPLEVESNINSDLPLTWSGRLLPKAACCKKFVFSNAFQLRHIDALTFDFLFNMAKELHEKQAMLFLGAGEDSSEPLVLSRNGKAYRAFLEGRIKNHSYLLVLHLSNLEMQPLPQAEGV